MEEKARQGLAEKYGKLCELIRAYRKVVVGFSGGVDSTFLLKVCCEVLNLDGRDTLDPNQNHGSKNVLAVTAESPLLREEEKAEASALCQALRAEQKIIKLAWEDMSAFVHNPPERCYLCKKVIFGKIKEEAAHVGISIVCDGSNADDALDYRPGEKAIRELGVRSPLREAGLTKQEIRELSKRMGLETWDKPAAACLASRIPYGEALSPEKLARIAKAEKGLHDMGFKQVRVRYHGEVARIEVMPEERSLFMEEKTAARADQIIKEAGFRFAALDLAGYRMGSLNPENYSVAGEHDTQTQ